MTRFVVSLVVIVLLLFSGGAAAQVAQPNFLWIIADDMSPDMGCYGDAYAETPNLDALAAQGVRYTNAFSVHGQCSPSRSALITGMYPTSIATHHMRCAGVPPAYVKCFTETLRTHGYYCVNNGKTDYNFGANGSLRRGIVQGPLGAWDENSRKAHWRGREKDQPFFAVFNLDITHERRVFASAEEFAKLTEGLPEDKRHDRAEAVLPPYYPDAPEVREDWARYYDLVTLLDMQVGDLLAQLDEDGVAENTVVMFFGDHGRPLPRAKRWLYDSGIRVPLLVRWPGQLEAGTVRDDLVSFVDFAPTLVTLGGGRLPLHMQGMPFLGPKAFSPRKHIFATRDRTDEVTDHVRAVRDKRYKYIRNYMPEVAYSTPIEYMDRMATMKVWRKLAAEDKLVGPQKIFFAARRPPVELYDTQEDPHEIRNLAESPDHKAIRDGLARALDHWIADTDDLGGMPEEELWERLRPGGEWAATESPTVVPSGGTFRGPAPIKLVCATEGATIVYTFDEGENARWQLYKGPFVVRSTGSLRVKAGRIGYLDSAERTFDFQISSAP